MPTAMINRPASVARWMISSAGTKGREVRSHVRDLIEREAEPEGVHILDGLPRGRRERIDAALS